MIRLPFRYKKQQNSALSKKWKPGETEGGKTSIVKIYAHTFLSLSTFIQLFKKFKTFFCSQFADENILGGKLYATQLGVGYGIYRYPLILLNITHYQTWNLAHKIWVMRSLFENLGSKWGSKTERGREESFPLFDGFNARDYDSSFNL